MNMTDRQAYRRYIAGAYDERSGSHDQSAWHRTTALRLVEHLPPRAGDSVLDIATGTGAIAFHAASLVGPTGRVVGVDLSKGMLARANEKLALSGLRNVEFTLADAENLEFPPDNFDRVYCASAFFCMLDPLATLRHWHGLLKPGGGLGFHAVPETSYLWVSLARRVLANYGISYVLNTPTGTIEKCRQLLMATGFEEIDVREERNGYHISVEKAKTAWIRNQDFAPGQYPHPLTNVPPEILLRGQRDYETLIDERATDKGVWNDITLYYVYGRKSTRA